MNTFLEESISNILMEVYSRHNLIRDNKGDVVKGYKIPDHSTL
jgi:hypothetical protein